MKNRVYGIDLIKVWAIISVITLHQLPEIGYFNTNFGHSGSMYLLPVFHIILLSCVPLFIMTSAYLLSSRKIDLTHYKKYLFFFLEVILIYFFGVLFYEFILGGIGAFTSFKSLIKLLLAPNYYVGLYTTLYCIAPFLNKFFFSLTDKEKKYFMIVLITFISLLKVQNLIPHLVYYSGWPTASYPILYYFLGLYFKHFQPELKKGISFTLIILLSVFYSIFMNYYMYDRTFYYILGHYEGIFTVLMTCLTFLLLYNVEVRNSFTRFILNFISSSTLSFYLLSTKFTDALSLKFITISEKMSENIITIPQKLVLSMLISLPVVLIIYFVNRMIRNRIRL